MRAQIVLLAAMAAAAAAAAVAAGVAGGATPAEPIKLGLIAPSGIVTYNLPTSIAGVKAAVRAWNAKGGIHGHPIELVYCNDKGDAAISVTCARKLAEEKVVASVGGGALNGAVITPILRKAGIAELLANPVTGLQYNSPNVYLFGAGNPPGFSLLAAYAAHQKQKLVLMSEDNTVSTALRASIRQTMKAAGGKDAKFQPIDDLAFSSWLAVYAIDKLTKGMPSITADALMQKLRTAKDVDLGGVIPPWTPNKKGPTGLTRASNVDYYIIGFKGGKPVLLTKKPITVAGAIAGRF